MTTKSAGSANSLPKWSRWFPAATRTRWQQRLITSAIWLMLFLTAFTRLTQLQDFPRGLNQDEAVNGYDAYTLWLTGRDHHGN